MIQERKKMIISHVLPLKLEKSDTKVNILENENRNGQLLSCSVCALHISNGLATEKNRLLEYRGI